MNSDSKGEETHKEIDGFKLKRWERPRKTTMMTSSAHFQISNGLSQS